MKNLLSLLFFLTTLLLGDSLWAQSTGKITGYVKDAQTGEPLIGASVLLENTDRGASTDLNGYFEIADVPTKAYTLKATYVGYRPKTRFNVVVRSAGNDPLTIRMQPTSQELEAVVVSSGAFVEEAESPLSVQKLSQEEIATYPGGNNDIAKVVQSLPGVGASVGGFRNDVIIRGGAPNENVYYLDGIEIPNINHFATQGSAGGPVGLLNVSFIEDVTLSTSAFKAQYNDPLSSVLQFDQREGNPRDFQGNLRVGASEAGLTLEGPLLKGDSSASNTSYLVSARRSYLQYLFQLLELPFLPDYWDYQYKITHKPDQYNTLNLIGVGSIDDFSINAPDEFSPEQQASLDQVPVIKQWTTTAGLSWRKRFRDGSGFMQTALSTNILNNEFSRFRDNEAQSGLFFRNDSRETERQLRYQLTRFYGDWKVSTGFNVQHSLYQNSTLDAVNELTYGVDFDFWNYGAFGQASRRFFGDRLQTSFGLRSDANTFTTQKNQWLQTLSPRLALSYALDSARRWSLNASVGRYYKTPIYTILGFQDNAGNFVNKDARYTRSDHYVAGLAFQPRPSTRLTLEGFWKRYDDYPVSVRDSVSLANKGADFEVLGNEPVRTVGKGRSYGLELSIQQKLKTNYYAILAYTLFWSEFTSFDTDDYRPSLWDSRHLLTFTGGYQFASNWELSLRNRFAAETPFVPLDLEATLANYPAEQPDYSRLGQVRLDVFNQLDVRIDKKWNFDRWSLNIFLEVQNILAQQIPEPPTYGLARDEAGNLQEPRRLVEVNVDQSTPIPTVGVVVDF
jgi:hypothetical protein